MNSGRSSKNATAINKCPFMGACPCEVLEEQPRSQSSNMVWGASSCSRNPLDRPLFEPPLNTPPVSAKILAQPSASSREQSQSSNMSRGAASQSRDSLIRPLSEPPVIPPPVRAILLANSCAVLREQCRTRGLKTSGVKSELAFRLYYHLNSKIG